MPKKFQGGNSKAIAANEKKAAAKAEKESKERAEKESRDAAKWETGAKRGGKKEELEAKRLEKLERKKEAERLAQQEEKEIAKSSMAKRGPPKLAPKPKPAAAAAATTDKAPARGAEKKALEKEHQIEAAAEENKPIESFSARNIDDILDLMDTIHDSTAAAPSAGGGQVSKGGAAAMIDRHPERRAKAAYQAYLERETPIVREENPHLRLSQIKDIVWKNWLKSPENPRNMSRIAHNATQEEIDAVIEGERKNIQDRLRI